MALRYKKEDHHSSQDTMWTSYSDLFLGLSIVFLLLYVVASLKQGTDGLRQMIENKDLKREVQDLKQQLSLYDSLKKDYLEKNATDQEQESYHLLMDKLSLLQEEAKDEKNKLRNQALENEKKEQALNQYQQMVRNVINANLLAKSKIKKRDDLIETKETIITEKTHEIKNLENTIAQKKTEIMSGNQKIELMENQLQKKMNELKYAYNSHKLTKKKFEQQQQAIMSETERKIAEIKNKKEQAEGELQRYAQQLKNTESKLGATSAQLTEKESQLSSAKSNIAQLGSKVDEMGKKYQASQAELAKAQENLNARKRLASQIKKNFSKAGVGAEVDANTGDVILSFGEHYFDTGKARLKPEMQKILEQAMPAYSHSLFEDRKISDKIQNVEIIGYASPTFKGKYVDPNSLDPNDRRAVNYNLDLSYDRAKSIFNFIFDKNNLHYKHQESLYPLVKVSGKSYLGQGKGSDYCSKNDCAKMQKVIIKFTLKD